MSSRNKRNLLTVLGLTLSLSLPSVVSAAPADGWLKSASLFEIRTLAGQSEWGHANGAASASTFFHPRSLLELSDGRVVVSDSGNNMIRVVKAGQVSTLTGLYIGDDSAGLPLGSNKDGQSSEAGFNLPMGVAADGQGAIYVADSGNHSIRKIAKDGTVTTLAGNGNIGQTDGKGANAAFYSPSDVAVDAQGNVYVADTLNNVIRKISPDGTVSTVTATFTRPIEYFPGAVEYAGDFADGPIATARFNEPSGLAIDAKGNLYVSDRGNQRIRYIDFGTGKVTTVAGGGSYAAQAPYIEGDYVDGAAGTARFNAPEGIAIAQDGTLIVADSLNHAVRLIRNGQVTTLTGVATEFGQADGVPGSAQFNHPTDVAVLSDGRLAISDEYGNKLRVLQPYSKPANFAAGKTVQLLLDGKLLKPEVAPRLKDGSVLIPLRSLGESLGYTFTWDPKTSTAVMSKGSVSYSITKGSKNVTKTTVGTASTDNQKLVLNGTPITANDRFLVPVRFFATESGYDIQWDAQANAVIIRSKSL
ncbi:stalk domain-containing protein [Cohnella faecalis]|uniref:Copper amine oxidase n=1 Tax=Cohnella faecalis TaxID=2315694 RepID=A0A398CLA2_9BACL|nr:stalk domain-containing protein [Cohnella faecalis]RIE00627.1 copper amine oxidase [Cohnella faecalis]